MDGECILTALLSPPTADSTNRSLYTERWQGLPKVM